jgi:ribosomal protein L7Ae-like RNA K-turn-binding protein
MKSDKIASYAGLAMKAGKAASGEFAVEKSVKEGKAYIVLIAADASDNTKKKFTDMCGYYGVPYAVLKDKEELGRMLGKGQRSCVSINDSGLAEALKKCISRE